MKIDMTLVRLIENKEPVAVFEKIDCIVTLGAAIDEVTDPARCEYCDFSIEGSLSLLFFSNCDGFDEDEDIQLKSMEGLSIGFDFKIKIMEAFLDSKNEWTEFPSNFDCLSVGTEIQDRFWSSNELGDIF